MLSLYYFGLSVVTDKTFEEWQALLQEFNDDMESGFIWLDYPEWAETAELVSDFNGNLDKENALIDQQYEELSREFEAKGDYTDEEWSEAAKIFRCVRLIPQNTKFSKKIVKEMASS